MHAYCEKEKKKSTHQGGRHWQPLGGRKNGHKIFCQAYLLFLVTNALLFGVIVNVANLIQ